MTQSRFPRSLRSHKRLRHDAPAFSACLAGVYAQKTIQAIHRELVSGDRLQVRHPEALILRQGIAVFITAEFLHKLFDSESVSQLLDEPG